MGLVVNRVIDFYNEDYRYTEEQYDAKMDELQAILISEDEEEIDDFLFEFYSKGLDERKIFVLSYKAPDWIEELRTKMWDVVSKSDDDSFFRNCGMMCDMAMMNMMMNQTAVA